MVRERTDRGNGSAPIPVSSGLSVAELRQLITLMDRSDIAEITIEQESEGMHLTLRKPEPVALDPSSLDAAGDPLDGMALELDPHGLDGHEAHDGATKALDVRATLVGFYRAVGKRGARPIAPGDSVKEGQIIGAVEALNVLNEIESPATGRVREVLVSDGQAVEYGQVLLVVEPREG